MMKKVKGHPNIEHTGVYVVNKNNDDYEIALKRLRRQSEIEQDREELKAFKKEISDIKSSLNEIRNELNMLIKMLR